MTCANRNGRSLEKEEKNSFTLLLDKYKQHVILKNQGEEDTSKVIDCYHSQKIYPANMGKIYWISQQNQDYMQKILPKKYFIKRLKQQKIDGK